MNSIASLMNIQATFLMFLAPPGWGKTSGLIDLLSQNNFNIIYLSPLNAINNEVYGRFSEKFMTFISKGELRDIYSNFFKFEKSVLISTPESLNLKILSTFNLIEKNILIVLDEVHLFYSWSVDFRPLLFEKLLEISSFKFPILGITATLSDQVEKEWFNNFKYHYDHLIKIDLGNHKLLNEPKLHFSFKNLGRIFMQNALRKKILNITTKNDSSSNKRERILVFFKYRKQVDWWLDYCDYNNIWALGCKGGQTDQFLTTLKNYPETQIIFSTIALGHGVNLPSFRSIWIMDHIKNSDYLLQMTARAGRRGEKYFLYSMQEFSSSIYKQLRHSVQLYLQIKIGINCES